MATLYINLGKIVGVLLWEKFKLVGWTYLPNNNFCVQLCAKGCKKWVKKCKESHIWSSLIFRFSIAFRLLEFSGVGQVCPTYPYFLPSKLLKKIQIYKQKVPQRDFKWRRNRDSNPRYARTYDGFQDRSNQPLWHSSKSIYIGLPVYDTQNITHCKEVIKVYKIRIIQLIFIYIIAKKFLFIF